MTTSGRVAMVMPPVATDAHERVVDGWSTVTALAEALLAEGEWRPTVHARHATSAATVERRGVEYRFHTGDAELVAALRAEGPDVVHVHGLGWTRLLRRLTTLDAPVLVQHHGEPVFTGRAKWGHRLVRRGLAGYLFTGASHGQAQPWIDAGVLRRDAVLHEVLEAASMLEEPTTAVSLEGAPAILWVGRLIALKDPVTAIRAFGLAAATLPEAHLHLLASDRTLEPDVRAAVEALGPVSSRVHLHDAVPHAEIAAWYRATDVVLSTSHREGSGYALIEALTCGCRPVVSDIPPHRAIVNDEGWRFPPGDAAAAAGSLVHAAAAAREPNASESRSLVSWQRVARETGEAYRRTREPATTSL